MEGIRWSALPRLWFKHLVSALRWLDNKVSALGNLARVVLYGGSAASLVGLSVDTGRVPVDALAPFAASNEYEKLLPPQERIRPGVFATVERRANGKVVHHLTCETTIDYSAHQVALSQTRIPPPDTSIARAIWNTVQGDRNEWVRDVAAVALSDEAMRHSREKLLLGSCEAAVIHNLKANAKVCQVREVLRATPVNETSEARQNALYFAVRFNEQLDCLKLPRPSGNTSATPS